MDCSPKERFVLPVLGEPHHGDAGRAVHGGRGDLRRRGIYSVLKLELPNNLDFLYLICEF